MPLVTELVTNSFKYACRSAKISADNELAEEFSEAFKKAFSKYALDE
jgi:two-component sensor histidine kinase